jgi:hypothetical protein
MAYRKRKRPLPSSQRRDGATLNQDELEMLTVGTDSIEIDLKLMNGKLSFIVETDEGARIDEPYLAKLWKTHRAELMASAAPGLRPVGWWWYETEKGAHLERQPGLLSSCLWLLELGLITETEAGLAERGHPLLCGYISDPQNANPWKKKLKSPDELRAGTIHMDDELLISHLPLLQELAAWHRWRNRPSIAELYELETNIIHDVLRERSEATA